MCVCVCVLLRPWESFPFLSNQSRMASWRRLDFRGYINDVRETFVQLGGKELEGDVLSKLGKEWRVGFQGDLCSWSEGCGGWGGVSAVAVQEVGKEDKESQVAEASPVKEEAQTEKGPEALKIPGRG